MKKTYMNPQCEEIKINSRNCLLSGSPIGGSGGDGLEDVGYGGIDTGGTLDPASREFSGDLEEDLDEEEYF